EVVLSELGFSGAEDRLLDLGEVPVRRAVLAYRIDLGEDGRDQLVGTLRRRTEADGEVRPGRRDQRGPGEDTHAVRPTQLFPEPVEQPKLEELGEPGESEGDLEA